MKWLLIYIAVVAAGWFYPLQHENASTQCMAFMQRADIFANGGKMTQADRILLERMMVGMLQEQFPNIPPQFMCVTHYWYSIYDPSFLKFAKY